MLQAVLVWLVLLGLTWFIAQQVSQTNKQFNRSFLVSLFLYHTVLTVAYYLYAISNPSDSHQYYKTVYWGSNGSNWSDYWGTNTDFVEFFLYPFVKALGMTYESSMLIFSFFGYLGFLFFYIFFKERIKTSPTIFGFDGAMLIFLLPNLHFWSASIGKGSIIFFGFGLFFYSLNRPLRRIAAFLIGGWLVYQIRSHIFFVMLIAIAIGYTFSVKGVNYALRIAILVVAGVILYNIYSDILAITGFEDESVFDPLVSHRASELTKATSGIDITNYSIPEKLFAFCFRPLFFDAPGILGFIVSFENLFYLILFIRILSPTHLKNLLLGDAIIKTCFLTFAGVSFALAQISGNLGLAMRQKSQVMMLMMFVVLSLLDVDKQAVLKVKKLKKTRLEKMKQQLEPVKG